MTATEDRLWTRCGLDRDHPPHDGVKGWCDGGATEDVPPALPMNVLYPVNAHPRPWSLSSLTEAQAQEVLRQLGRFVTFYNRAYAVQVPRLILGCWADHEAVIYEVASLYGSWVAAFQSSLSSADLTSIWHDRWLPGFQKRLPDLFGGGEGCKPGRHVEGWNTAAEYLAKVAKLPDGASSLEAVAARVANRANPAHIEG